MRELDPAANAVVEPSGAQRMPAKALPDRSVESRSAPLARGRFARGELLADSAFVAFVAVSTGILWVSRVGFYSDDWSFLRIFRFSPDQSLPGLFRAIFVGDPGARMRPLELLYYAGLYKLSGLHPLGYQIVNLLVLAAIGVLLSLLLRELGQPRMVSVAVAAIYVTLPNYTTARIWMSSFTNLLSIVLYLSSFHADLRSLRASGRAVWGWRAVGLASLIGCLLAYEVALPLFAVNIMVILVLARRAASPDLFRRARATALWNMAGLFGVALFKIATKVRGDRIHGSYIRYVARVARNAVRMHWAGYGLGFPLRVFRAVQRHPDARVLAMSIAVAAAVGIYLWRVSRREAPRWPARRHLLIGLLLGFVVFALGHGIFLVTDVGARGGFTMTGKNNRVAVAAALGVALCFVAGVGYLTSFLGPRRRAPAFAVLIALVAAGGSLIDNTVANFWASAHAKQMAVLASIEKRFPKFPPQNTLILDGVCVYVGPAVVFKSQWDLASLLSLRYEDPTLRADVVSRQMLVQRDGLVTKSYEEQTLYPYSDELIVFDPRFDSVVSLPDLAAAQSYFKQRPPVRCPPRENL